MITFSPAVLNMVRWLLCDYLYPVLGYRHWSSTVFLEIWYGGSYWVLSIGVITVLVNLHAL